MPAPSSSLRFAGGSLARLNASLWRRWDLPGYLDAHLQPYLGGVNLSVVDALTAKPVVGAVATVTYKEATHVTRKASDATGQLSFGGWCGKAALALHTVRIAAAGYHNDSIAKVAILPKVTQRLVLKLNPVLSSRTLDRT